MVVSAGYPVAAFRFWPHHGDAEAYPGTQWYRGQAGPLCPRCCGWRCPVTLACARCQSGTPRVTVWHVEHLAFNTVPPPRCLVKVTPKSDGADLADALWAPSAVSSLEPGLGFTPGVLEELEDGDVDYLKGVWRQLAHDVLSEKGNRFRGGQGPGAASRPWSTRQLPGRRATWPQAGRPRYVELQ